MSNDAPAVDTKADRNPRVYLFLQGPASPLFRLMAQNLETSGATVLRINFNLGDQIFWWRKGATNYRGTLENWPNFINDYLERNNVTDVILIGEERDYHRIAIEFARKRSANILVVDMGYLRPDWITLEHDGISSNSRFPADPESIINAAAALEEPDWDQRFAQSFSAEAAYDLAYNLPNVLFWYLYPNHKRHAIYHPLAEYAAWVGRLISKSKREREAAEITARLQRVRPSYFLYPLQLQTDFQLRVHSPYLDQRDAIYDVLQSFSDHAPTATELLIKTHPLDTGLVNWKSFIAAIAKHLKVEPRIHFMDGGNLEQIIGNASGIVTVNSTAALHGLDKGIPTKTLGEAIYNIAGLTDQRPLDSFWRGPEAPDRELTRAFYRLMAHSIQVRGNLSSKIGAVAAATEAASRIMTQRVNQPNAYCQKPMRRRPKKKTGISLVWRAILKKQSS